MSTRRVIIEATFPLEGILFESDRSKGALILHPHPLYGGNMENNVVKAINNGFRAKGFTTLRFNFRGVGGSGGSYSEGIGEKEDALAALNYLLSILERPSKIVVAGYSFGAWIGTKIIEEEPLDVNGLLLVSYPFSTYGSPDLSKFKGKLCLIGALYDEISNYREMVDLYKKYPYPDKNIKLIPASHFFWGMEKEITDFVFSLF